MTWRCPESPAHSRTLLSDPGSRTARTLGLPSPSLPLVVACPDSAPLLFSPQLWDIRRKGCVFRYRVRQAPCIGHSTSALQAWSTGGAQTGEGWRVLLSDMGENVRNESPNQERESGAQPGCCGWSTRTTSFLESP